MNNNWSGTLHTTQSMYDLLSEIVKQSDLGKIFEYRRKIYNNFRIVYGGKYTIMLDKDTGNRVCMVTREPKEKNNLYKAVAYLVLKYYGIGGKEIQGYLDKCPTTYMGLMEYLLEYGHCQHYTHDEVMKLHELIEVEQDPELGFLYILLYDRLRIEKCDMEELVKQAVCSEKTKNKRRKATKAYEEKLKKNPIKRPTRKAAKSRGDLEQL